MTLDRLLIATIVIVISNEHTNSIRNWKKNSIVARKWIVHTDTTNEVELDVCESETEIASVYIPNPSAVAMLSHIKWSSGPAFTITYSYPFPSIITYGRLTLAICTLHMPHCKNCTGRQLYRHSWTLNLWPGQALHRTDVGVPVEQSARYAGIPVDRVR